MENRNGTKWNRSETILAFDLYCKTPYAKISKSNPEIIELAQLLGRTPSSVGLKMANLAACDPEVIKKNLHGMSNGSKLDKEIFEEFSADWEALAFEAQKILASYKHIDYHCLNPELHIEQLPAGEYREQQSKIIIGQYFFRKTVLNAYGNRCCVTGLSVPQLLIASHIKPWKDSDAKTERTNPSNGLCLNAFYDKAFDQGLITVDKNLRIITSRKLFASEMDDSTREWVKTYDKKEIILPDKFIPAKEFLEYHNDVVFLG